MQWGILNDSSFFQQAFFTEKKVALPSAKTEGVKFLINSVFT